jgi:trigger factor
VNVTIEDLAPCRKKLRVDVDAQTVNNTFEEVTSAMQREVKLPGFRPGKVPKQMVQQNFSRQLEDEVRRKLLNESWRDAVQQHKLHVVGSPSISDVQFGRGKEFAFTAEIETAPEFELPDYKGLPVRKEIRSVNEADVDRAINMLRERQADFADVERPAHNGDIVVVNYEGKSEGKPLLEIAPTARGLTTQQNFWIEIKPGSFIPGFSEQLVGASRGDKRTVNIQFPNDFVSSELSGKPGVYEVEIVQIKEKKLPELNDEFALKWGAENLEKLKEGVRRDLENELERKISRSVRSQVLQGLAEKVQLELPAGLLQGETRNVIYDLVMENQQRGVAKETIDEKKDEIFNYASSTAKEKLKLGFIMGKIAEKENIQVTQEEIANQVYHMAQEREVRPEKVVKELRKTNGFNQIHEQILFSKVVDLLVKNAQVEEVQPSAEEAQPQA